MAARRVLLLLCWAGSSHGIPRPEFERDHQDLGVPSSSSTPPLGLTAAAAARASGAFPPPPPPTTDVQRSLLARAATTAKAASAASVPAALAMLGSPGFQIALGTHASSALTALSPAALLGRWVDEVAAAELVHNFAAVASAHSHGDVTLPVLDAFDYFPNLWQLQSLGLAGPQCARNQITTSAEEGLFHYAPFKNESCPTWTEAESRFIYGAWNVYRVDAGNPHFGSVSAVFTSGVVMPRALIAPVDTGIWEMGCNRSSGGMSHHWPVFCSGPALAGWGTADRRPLGSFADFVHIMLPQAGFWNPTAPTVPGGPAASSPRPSASAAGTGAGAGAGVAPTYQESNLARLIARLADDGVPYSAAVPLTDAEAQSMYYEANIAGAVFYKKNQKKDRGVKALLASFQALYGSPPGARLADWCRTNDVVLFWSYNPLSDRGSQPRSSYMANVRLVDPAVALATTANLTAEVANASALFGAVWDAAAAALPQPNASVPSPSLPAPAAAALWSRLWGAAPTESRYAPLRARSCADLDGCVGVTPTGQCLCYSAK